MELENHTPFPASLYRGCIDEERIAASLVIPPVAAQRAVIEAATGSAALAVLHLLAAAVGLLVLAVLWRNLLGWMLTTPREGSRPAARAARRPRPGRRARPPLGWRGAGRRVRPGTA